MDDYQGKIRLLSVEEMNDYHSNLKKIESRCAGNKFKLKFLTRKLANPYRGRTGELGWLSKQKPDIMYDITKMARYNMVSENDYDSKFATIIDELTDKLCISVFSFLNT